MISTQFVFKNEKYKTPHIAKFYSKKGVYNKLGVYTFFLGIQKVFSKECAYADMVNY